MRIFTLSVGAAVVALAAAAVGTQGRGNPTDWPTAYGDAQHTSWVRSDANISPDTMAQPGFALQWKTPLDSPMRQGVSLGQGVVTPAVNLFTPLSTVAGAANVVFAVDNDTGNVFWTRRFEGALAAGTVECPGGISGAVTRMVDVVPRQGGAGRGGGGRGGGRAYGGAVGEPGEGVPIPSTGGRGGRGTTAPAGSPAGRGTPAEGPPAGRAAPPAASLPASPFPTNPAAVAAAGGGGGGLFRSAGVVYVVSADGMLRTLGLVSGKDVQRPAPFLPAGARFSDLIAAAGMIYTATSQGCAGADRAIWAMNTEGDARTVVSWKTNGGDPLGSVAFTTSGTAIVAVGSGPATAGGYANAVVALDPKTLALKDWFMQPGVEIAAPPVVFEERGRNIVAVTTKDGRLLLLDSESLGGANHATPLAASTALVGRGATFAPHSPALWQEPPAGAATTQSGTRWMLIPVSGPNGAVVAVKITHQDGTFAVQPGWQSESLAAPLTPLVVNGVVFAVTGAPAAPARLFVLSATTGKTLWQSGTTIVAPVSSRSFWTGSGHVFVGTRDGTLYAFGFDMERGSPKQRSGAESPAAPAQTVTSEQRQSIDAALPSRAPAKPKQRRRLLVVNLQMRNGAPVQGPSFAALPAQNYALEQMGKRTGAYDMVVSNDVQMFRPDSLAQFDAVCFCNSLGVLFDDPELRKSLLDFVAAGKGIVGIHDGLATFVQWPQYDQWPEFGRMLGGTENGGHPWDGEMSIKVDDPASPLAAMFGRETFTIRDQAFQLQEPSLRDRLHVLLSIDVSRMAPPRRQFFKTRIEDKDFPMSWIKPHGKGRVFYTAFGHSDYAFWNPKLLEHILAGIQYALGDLQADDAPSVGAKR